MKRTFIAVDISADARARVASYSEGLRSSFPDIRVGWERPEKLHLTLKFLGDVEERLLKEIQSAVRKVADSSRQFDFSLVGTGRFPLKGDPKVLWLGVNDNGSLEKIVEITDKAMTELGFARERRRFTPHLTIARLREPSRSYDLARRHEGSGFGPIEQTASEIAIYESHLLPSGSVYRQIDSFPLSPP